MKEKIGSLGMLWLAITLLFATAAEAQRRVATRPTSVPDALLSLQNSVDAIAVSLTQLRNDTQLDHGSVQTDLDSIQAALADLQDSLVGLGSTLNSLDDIPRAWARALPAAERFEVVFDGTAVLDHETGLVWERTPSTRTFPFEFYHCFSLVKGGRTGFRKPTASELMSLLDPLNDGGTAENPVPRLPSGHPFTDVRPEKYWTSTVIVEQADGGGFPQAVNFGRSGRIVPVTPEFFETSFLHWCVRGGGQSD